MYDEERPYKVVADPVRDKGYRAAVWSCAEGLQAVDGLELSRYGRGLGRRYVDGLASSSQIADEASAHYARSTVNNPEAEADIVAARIARTLDTTAFTLAPRLLFLIHRGLFKGILPDDLCGVARPYNISKPEPVLGGESVAYCDWRLVADQLDYDFGEESRRGRRSIPDEASSHSFARFISDVWQTHPFAEGNTRTCAVFSILYLRALGVDVDNGPFARNSLYFRDSMVRANWSSIQQGIPEDHSFIESFYDCVIFSKPFRPDFSEINLHGIGREVEAVPYREPDEFPSYPRDDAGPSL